MKFITVILLIVVVVVVLYGGLTIYSNCQGPNIAQNVLPDQEKATHSFHIENTGGLILGSDFEEHGQEVGKRIFILHGYWEMRGSKFKFVQGDCILNEAIFGKIRVERR